MCSLGRAGSSPAPGTLQQHPNIIMRQFVILFVIFLFISYLPASVYSQSYTSFMTGDPADVTVSVQPGFVLAGGGTDNDEAMKWMLSRAKGGDVLVLRASGSDGYNDYFYDELAVNVHSVETILFLSKSASSEPYVLDRIRNAEIIFIAGGDQTRYYDYWSGTETGEMLKTICKERTKVIGGTSAGMMILGNLVYAPLGSGVTSSEALSNPYHPNLNNIKYNAFLQTPIFSNTIFDSHFDDRSRDGRLMVFLAKAAFERNIRARAIACNESTAVCIDENNIAIVFGDTPQYPEYAYFMEVNCEEDWKPTLLAEDVKAHWITNQGNAVIVQRLKGTKIGNAKFDLNTWKAINDSDASYWQINDGQIQKKVTTFTNCSLISSNIDDENENQLSIYPNPTDSVVYFPFAELAELYSMDGKMIISNKNVSEMDINFCNSGKYVLNLTINKNIKSFEVIKN